MTNKLNIVMYHYVRPIKNSNFPLIKGLELDQFVKQLEFFTENNNVVTVDEIKCAIQGRIVLPKNAFWLTFDDGYKDHYDYVFPELKKRNLQGTFFPPAATVTHKKLLDVNAIHYILASCHNHENLKSDLNKICLKNGFKDKDLILFWQTYGIPNRFDNATVIYIKRLLQHALPEELRHSIADELFRKYVGISPLDLCSDLYMSEKQVSELVSSGMHVGSHGGSHYWLNKLTYNEQKKDLLNSLNFLEHVGAPTSDWVLCYPYGAYNQSTLKVAKELGAQIGLTTKVACANLNTKKILELPRFDTNDFIQ